MKQNQPDHASDQRPKHRNDDHQECFPPLAPALFDGLLHFRPESINLTPLPLEFHHFCRWEWRRAPGDWIQAPDSSFGFSGGSVFSTNVYSRMGLQANGWPGLARSAAVMNFEHSSGRANPPSRRPGRGPSHEHPMTRVFLGPEGLRVGWRLAFAASLWFVFSSLLSALILWIPSVRAMLQRTAAPGHVVLTPALVLFSEGILAAAALLAGLVMSRVESRPFVDYGLPGRAAFGKRFWQGALFGFAMISLLMGLIAILHGYSVNGVDLRGLAALRYALFYFAAFIGVAMFEEFAFRGYLQSTLQLTTGFWPAAAVLAAVFGVIHLSNPGERAYGVMMAGCFGLLAAFTLWRTGSIWFAIGLHAAWDWGETYFYSVRDSGVPAAGHFLHSDFRGPVWLTGGSVGPEGSAMAFAVLVVAAIALHLLLPSRERVRNPAA